MRSARPLQHRYLSFLFISFISFLTCDRQISAPCFTPLADVLQGQGKRIFFLCFLFLHHRPLVGSRWNVLGKVIYASAIMKTKGPGKMF